MSEIITLQIGNFSNFIGTHFWNFQIAQSEGETPELNLDVLYRSRSEYDVSELPLPLEFNDSRRERWLTLLG